MCKHILVYALTSEQVGLSTYLHMSQLKQLSIYLHILNKKRLSKTNE